jgi:hypothetical protein
MQRFYAGKWRAPRQRAFVDCPECRGRGKIAVEVYSLCGMYLRNAFTPCECRFFGSELYRQLLKDRQHPREARRR